MEMNDTKKWLMDAMRNTDKNKSSGAANAHDLKFAEDMIPHHQMALRMSAAELAAGADSEMKAFATRVRQKQSEEIEWMKRWLQKNKPTKGTP